MCCRTDRMLPNSDFTGIQEQLVRLCSREARGVGFVGASKPKPNMLSVSMPTDSQPQPTHACTQTHTPELQ